MSLFCFVFILIVLGVYFEVGVLDCSIFIYKKESIARPKTKEESITSMNKQDEEEEEREIYLMVSWLVMVVRLLKS